MVSAPVQAAAGTNQQINFQGRLLNAAGAVIPDGTYNMEFKIYQDGDGLTAGDTTGSPAGSLKWTEDWLGNQSHGVVVKNGYFSVALGSVNAFGSSVDWNQSTLFLSMTVASGANATSSSCTTFTLCNSNSEVEMLPMKRLTSSVYAMNAGQLGGLTSAQYVQLAQGIQTASMASNAAIGIKSSGGSNNFITLQNSSNVDVLDVTSTGDLTFGANADKNLTVATPSTNAAGKALTVSAGDAGSGATGVAGGRLTLQGGDAAGTSGNANGGDVNIFGGAKVNSGTVGNVVLAYNLGTSSIAGSVTIGTATADQTLTVAGSGAELYATGSSNSAVTTGTNWLRTAKNTVTVFVGNNDTTTAANGYTATDASATIRFNGLGVAWGDIGYYPQGGGSNTPEFIFSTTGSTISSTPNALVAVGSLIVQGTTGLTTGTTLKVNASTYSHTATETGSATSIAVVDATSATGALTTTTNGLGITSQLNVTGTGTGTKTVNALSVSAATLTSCSATNSCVWNGSLITTQSSGVGSNITQNGVNVAATGVASGNLNGINISGITQGGGTENAINIGSGWDAALVVGSTTVINGSGVTTVAGGGTGISSYTQGDILYASASGTLSRLADVAVGSCLVSGGVGGNPSWGTCGAGGSGLSRTAMDTGSAAATSGNYYLALSNSSTAVASGTVKIDNGNNTGTALFVTATAGTLFDLQNGGASKFSVSSAGVITATDTGLTSGSHISVTTTINPTGGGTQTAEALTVTNSPTTTANTAIGNSTAINDSTALANTLQGVKVAISDTGSGIKVVQGVAVDMSGTTNTNVSTHPVNFYGKTSNPSQTGYVSYGVQIQNSSSQDLFTVTNSGAVTVTGRQMPGANVNGADALTVSGGAGATGVPSPGTGGIGLVVTGGNGGASSGGAGAAGGDGLRVTAGNGGAGTTTSGGAAGAIKLTAGNGGSSVSASGVAGGDITLTGGNAGSTTGGTNGTGGSIKLVGGAIGTGGSGGAGGGVLVKNTNDTSIAFLIQKAGSTANLFAADTSAGTVSFGTGGSLTGLVNFYNSTGTNAVGLQAGASTAAYTLTLPTAAPTASGQCLQSSGSSPFTTLTFTSCGGGGGASVTLNNLTVGGVAINTDLQYQAGASRVLNIAANGSGAGNQLTVAAGSSSGAFGGGNLVLQAGAKGSAGSVGSVIVKANGSDSATAFQVQTSGSVPVLTADTTNVRVTVGNLGTATAQLYVGGKIPTTTAGNVGVGGSGAGSAAPRGEAIQGNYLYVVNSGSGTGANTFGVYDVSNPASPVAKGTTTYGLNTPFHVVVSGRYAYVTNAGTTGGFAGTMAVVDVSNPNAPTVVGTVATGSTPQGIAVSGRYAYVINYGSGTMSIIDISNPSGPTLVTNYIFPSTPSTALPYSVVVSGKYAYVGDFGNEKLYVIDVSAAQTPVLTGSLALSGTADPEALFIQGRYVYIGNNTANTFQIADVSNPASPTSVFTSSALTSANPTSVYVQGRYAFMTRGGDDSVDVWDVSTPGSATNIGNIPVGITPLKIIVQGRYGYVTSMDDDKIYTLDFGGSYSQQFEAGGISTGALAVTGDASLNGSATLLGGLAVGKDLQVSGDIGASGGLSLNSASGKNIVALNVKGNTNLVANNSFEIGNAVADPNVTGWSKILSPTTFATDNAAMSHEGAESLKIVTTAGTAQQGAKYTYALSPNTSYTFTAWVGGSSSFTSMNMGSYQNGSTSDCLTSQIVATTMTQYRCTFTTGATTVSTDGIYIRDSSTTSHTFYIDDVSLTRVDQSLVSMIDNGSFENGNVNGAVLRSASGASGNSIAVTTEQAKFGSRSLKLITGTSTGAGNGVQFQASLFPNAQYSFNFWAKNATGSATAFAAGRAENLTDTNCTTNPALGTAGITTSWTQYTCTFTTGSSVGGAPNVYLIQTDTATSRTIYIDGVTLVQASTGLSFTAPSNNLQLDAVSNVVTINGGNSGELQPWRSNPTAVGATTPGGAGQARQDLGTVTANGYIYAVGGYNGAAAQSTVYYAKMNTDGSVGNWTSTTALPAVRRYPAVGVANGYLYAIGGDGGSAVSTVYYAKLNNDGTVGTWQTNAATLPSAREASNFVFVNGFVYIVGGCSDSTGTASLGSITYGKVNADGSINSWTTDSDVLPASALRCMSTAVYANGFIYWMGGAGSSGGSFTAVYSTAIQSDGSIGAFSTLNSLPGSRREGASAVLNGFVYYIGGYDGAAVRYNQVYYAKINGDGTLGGWQTAANALPSTRASSGYAIANSYFYVLGGIDNLGSTFSAIFYTSTARTLIGGALDLVGLSGQTLSDASGSGQLTAGNTWIIGALKVDGLVDFNNGLTVDSSLSINAVSAATGQTVLNINNSSSNSIFSVRHMNTQFGSLIKGGAFEGRDSYYGEEFNAAQPIAPTMTGTAGAVSCSWARGDYGGHVAAANTACTVTANSNAGTGELSLGYNHGVTGDQCAVSQPVTVNGIERITETSAASANTGVCGEFLTGSGGAGAMARNYQSTNLPVMALKMRPSTLASSSNNRIFAGFYGSATAGLPSVTPGTAASTGGVYFTNCSNATPTCANGTWYGWSENAGALSSVTCTGTLSTTQFAYGRIEFRSSSEVHFYIDVDTSDGINEQECGSGITTNVPSISMTPFFETVTNAASLVTALDIDYIHIWQDDNLGGAETEALPVADTPAPLTTDSHDADVSSKLFSFSAATNEDTIFNHDVYVRGTLYADKIKANQIEGLDVLSDNISSLQAKVAAAQAPAPASTPAATPALASPTLNLSGVTISSAAVSLDLSVTRSLAVGGNADFRGTAFFRNLVTFFEPVLFKGDVEFAGRPTFNNDTAGYATIYPTQQSVEVKFDRPYDQTPVVVVSLKNGLFEQYSYKDLTPNGFTIVLPKPAAGQMDFSWYAVNVRDAKTMSVPTPSPSPSGSPPPKR